MSEEIMGFIEDSPHIEINLDGSTIDLSNWHQPANRNWGYRNVVDFMPYTQKISRGTGPVHEFGESPVDLSSITVNYRGRDMQLAEYQHEIHCDALLVLKGNEVVYENHIRMSPQERHLIQSVSKTTINIITGVLIDHGLINPQQTVDHYIPQVASGYKGVKVQDLLDMNVALKFSEDFTDSDADIFEYEMINAWHPERAGQAEGILPYISKIEHDPETDLDGTTNYLCPNTDMLGCIVEHVTGKRFTQLFEEMVYQHIGAEADAYLCTDATGMAVCSGGLVIRLRDLARYGQIFANRGKANDGTQVIPESWIDECRDQSKGTAMYMGTGYRYHNQILSNGLSLVHLGICGQMMYANPETNVVVVQFSTVTMPSAGDLDTGNVLHDLGDAISDFLEAAENN